jgi:hypothetical protein
MCQTRGRIVAWDRSAAPQAQSIMVALCQLHAMSITHMVALCQLRATSTTHMVARVLCATPRNSSVSHHVCRSMFRTCKKIVGLKWGGSPSQWLKLNMRSTLFNWLALTAELSLVCALWCSPCRALSSSPCGGAASSTAHQSKCSYHLSRSSI